jgi:hypothetical protein
MVKDFIDISERDGIPVDEAESRQTKTSGESYGGGGFDIAGNPPDFPADIGVERALLRTTYRARARAILGYHTIRTGLRQS